MTPDQKRLTIALPLFVAGAPLAAFVSPIAGGVCMVGGLAALLWGRKVGDRRPK